MLVVLTPSSAAVLRRAQCVFESLGNEKLCEVDRSWCTDFRAAILCGVQAAQPNASDGGLPRRAVAHVDRLVQVEYAKHVCSNWAGASNPPTSQPELCIQPNPAMFAFRPASNYV